MAKLNQPLADSTKPVEDHMVLTFDRTLDAALFYAVRGWSIFPAPPGEKKSYKSSAFSNGRRWGQTKNPAVIQRNFRKWPGANIGLPTGPDNGFFVVEADTPKGHDVDGIASLRSLESRHSRLPKTLMAQSPTGSLHYYFKYPDGVTITNSASKIAAGVDVRGDGGMVIAPPSVKPGVGRYVWLNDATIAPAPAWLIKLATKPAKPPAPNRTIETGKPKTLRPSTYRPVDRDKVQAALDQYSSYCSYDVWFETAAALRFEFGDAGFDMFDRWSAQSPQYDEAECAAKWRGVANVKSYSAATILHFANQASPGWRAIHEAKLLAEAFSFFRFRK
jgi:hypothetical protein